MKLTSEQIEKAVNWWADRVTAPDFSALSEEERKDPGNILMKLAGIISYTLVQPVSAEQREKFIESLRMILSSDNAPSSLFVDYEPCQSLHDAANEAVIGDNNFPWKTDMWFRDEKVIVAQGYAADHVEI